LIETPLKKKLAIVIKILSIFTLGEVIEVSTNQYGLSIFSGMVSLLVLGIYTLLTVGVENDDDDSDSGGGGLMQPVN